MTTIEFRILGCFTVLRDGVPVAVGGSLPQLLLVRLLTGDGPVSIDQLVEDLWAGQAPPRAAASVHGYVSRLRGLLGRDLLERMAAGYRLDPAMLRLDAADFSRLLADGARAAAEGRLAAAGHDLEAALALWSGPQAFGPYRQSLFAQPEAQRLEECRFSAVEQLADLNQRLGRPERTLPTLVEHVAQAPLRESLIVRVVRAMADAGRSAEALAVYETARRRLCDELGVDPGAELQAEHARLLAGAGPATVWRLPSRNRGFTGRAELLAQAGDALDVAGEAPRLVALCGMPGVGKSELALELAHRRRPGTRLTWWVRADGEAALSTGLAEVAAALHVPRRAHQEDLVTAVWDELARRGRWLIVFDNVEDPEVLAAVLPPTGDGEVIVTSRNPAWRGLGPTLTVPPFDREESRAFLGRRSGEHDPVLVDELAEALSDLPLALEHACAYIAQTGIGLAAYRSLLVSHPVELLAAPSTADPGRPSIASTWRVAFERVRQRSAPAARMLELLAFLAPDSVPDTLFRADGTDELAVNQHLSELLRLSLVDRQWGALRTHRLVQAVVRAWLDPADRDRRLGEAVELVVGEAAVRRPQDWGDLVPQVLVLTDHLLEAGGTHPRSGALLQLAVPCAHWLAGRALFPAAIQELEKAVGLARSCGDRLAEGVALSLLGEITDRSGDWATARPYLEAALAVLGEILPTDDPRIAHTHNRLGHVLNCEGEAAAAIAVQRRALQLADRSTQPRLCADILTDLGYSLWAVGELEPSRAAFCQALDILGALPDAQAASAHTLAGLGMVQQDCGLLREALATQRRALEMFTDEYGPVHQDVAQTWDKLGYVLRLLGDHAGAVAAHDRAAADLGMIFGADDPRVAMALTNGGLAHRAVGQHGEARQAQERAYRIFAATYGEEHPSTVLAARRLAVATAEDGSPVAARALAVTAFERVRRTHGSETAELARAEADLALVLDTIGEDGRARAHRLRAALIMAKVLGPDHHEVRELADLVGSPH